ncbi:14422_t:CDS:2, partial [Racocetra persica]
FCFIVSIFDSLFSIFDLIKATLPLHQLIAPSKSRRRKHIPKPQNKAAKNWVKESNEVKQLYELLADCTKQVHNIVYPNYSYKPKYKSFPLNRVSQDIICECPSSKNLHIQTKKSLILDKKEIEIKHLRDAYKITIYGSKTKIHISDCLNSKNAENSSNEYGTTFLKYKKSTLSLNEFNDKDPEESLNEFNNKYFDHDHSREYGTSILKNNEPSSSLNEFNDEDFEEQLSLLSQILNKFNDKDSEEVWIHINSILERIFGYENILKSSNNEHRIYLKLIFELQNCELLKPYKELIELCVSKAKNIFGTLKDDQTLLSSQKVTPTKKISSENDKYKKVTDKLREKINTSVNDIIEPNVDKESNIENKESNIETIKQNL